MIQIDSFRVEDQRGYVVTDRKKPRFSFSFSGDGENRTLKKATITLNGLSFDATSQVFVPYPGKDLKPYTVYEARLEIEDDRGEKAEKTLLFQTGRMNEPWKGKWISDKSYDFTEKKVSPKVMTFRKTFAIDKKVKKAEIYSTAIGVYDLLLNGKRAWERYLAPGFTSYEHHLQYQVTDITDRLEKENTLLVPIAGGWAVGCFVMNRANRIYAKRQALLLEIRIEYKDGSIEVIPSDTSFEVTMEGPYTKADLYNGEDYDATISYESVSFHKAGIEETGLHPRILAEYGLPIGKHEEMVPLSVKELHDGHLVYDFGQNFAGILSLTIPEGKKGRKVHVRHGEILNEDGHVNTALLRSARQEIFYTEKDGEQTYEPTFSYMGFRYVEIDGVRKEEIKVKAYALYSDMEEKGDFLCSEKNITRLQKNIKWSSKSNFLDIPTDCPQRDERMGWTGDIALFANVATYNFELNALLEKWLYDLQSEQKENGALPTTVPHKGYSFPMTFPTVPCDFWGDAALLVPLAMYQSYGNKEIVEKLYPTMKKYVDACLRAANAFGLGKRRYIWHTLDFIHFGDWVAPGMSMMACQHRHPYTATASLFNTSTLLSRFASILGKEEDKKKYEDIARKVGDAYQSVFFDENGKIRKKEFQTAYVLPLYFHMLDEKMTKKAADRLAELVKENDYKIGTGFPGTPYVLFALYDNGHEEEAMKMLLNTKNPSWLHEVVQGGTTIWERFDAIDDNGKLDVPEDGTGGMISFNHYASGAVGDFFYRRILGLEPLEPGYKTFQVKPILRKEIPSAKGYTDTPYGRIEIAYEMKDGRTRLEVLVPANTKAQIVLKGMEKEVGSGRYSFEVTD